MFRCASRSFARFRANWALLRCVTDLFPPRAPVAISTWTAKESRASTIPFFLGSSSMGIGLLELVLVIVSVILVMSSES